MSDAPSDGIWARQQDGSWRAVAPSGFDAEAQLHNLVERNPAMLPLSGSPNLVVLGSQVPCGRGYADLLAVEADSGRPVIIEIKRAANSDRRQVFAQVLGYAAWLRRLDRASLEHHLSNQPGWPHGGSISEVVAATTTIDVSDFETNLAAALQDGRIRCVVVLDSAPSELVELAAYLQHVTNDRLVLDVVTVSRYQVGSEEVLVPSLVEADDSALVPGAPFGAETPTGTKPVPGEALFAEGIAELDADTRARCDALLGWAKTLQGGKLAALYSTPGRSGPLLQVRIAGEEVSLVTVWAEGGGRLSPYRTVFQRFAPIALSRLDQEYPGAIQQGNVITAPYVESLLSLLTTAYEEALQAAASEELLGSGQPGPETAL